jgi:uncharacterized caspase-like protein
VSIGTTVRGAVLILACFAATPAGSAPATHPGVKRALLIGINRYVAVPSLKGAVNDVMTMKEVLIQRWGFDAANIAMLIDEQATRDHMMAALETIVRDSNSEDTVYIHYSGHGSQVQDLNGDEEDGLDETLVPQNGRTPGVRDIVDDELAELLAKLRSRNVLIVLDSCHSGTATRSVDIRARSVPQDKRIDLYKAVPQSRAVIPRMQSRFVVMSATSEEDEALDGPIQGQYHGFFSYALASSLSSAAPNATAREVFSGALEELKRVQQEFGRISMPEPQLEGPSSQLDQPLLGLSLLNTGNLNMTVPRLSWASVRGNGKKELILVKAATLGAIPGSTWSIFPPNEMEFRPGAAIAVAVVERTSGFDAVATLSSKPVFIPPGSRAVASVRASQPARIAIEIQGGDQARRQQVRDLLLKNSPELEIAGPGTPGRFILDLSGTKFQLLTADGLQAVAEFDGATSNWAVDAARIIVRSHKASELLALDNPAAQLKVSVSASSSLQTVTRDIVLAANTQPTVLHVRAPGDPRTQANSLQLAVTVTMDAYVTIVDVDSEGDVNLLFPNGQQSTTFLPSGLIRGNTRTLIPDTLKPDNTAGFYWDFAPPKGVDTVRVFASTNLAGAEAIRRRIGALPSASGTDPLTALHDDLQKLASANVAVESGNAGSGSPDWAAASVTLTIQDNGR